VSVDQEWWHIVLWKLQASLKIILFAWLRLHDRILTGKNYMLRGGVGPSVCIFCLRDEETTKHLFVHCEVTQCIWKEVCAQLRINRN
jgi:hypothetical protein